MPSDSNAPGPDLASGPPRAPRNVLQDALWGRVQHQGARARLRSELFGAPFEPVRVGRFALLGRIGAGAMGVVHAGYDDTLDRKVAIKLISSGSAGSQDARPRMLREAQAMAKLSHPNVVQIYEAGMHEGQMFIAMEFVDGQTLRKWNVADDGPRPWREVLAAYLQAGRGLAAAHEAGLVHRDFKPDNAMVDRVGQVRVLDFGLARGAREPNVVTRSAAATLDSAEGSGFDTPLTQSGAVVGTPAYMAPEQLDGHAADARTDQFSFCVALWEALYGQRPFAADSIPALQVAIAQGRPVAATPNRAVPDVLQQALRRGLSADPEDRWRDLGALLDALSFDPARKRRRWLAAGGGATLIAVGALGARQLKSDVTAPCTTAAEQLVGVWDEARRDRAHAAFSAVGASYSVAAWDRTATALDAYAEDWTQTHTATCQATAVHGDQSSAVMDLRMACLHRAKVSLDAIAGVLTTADGDVVSKAHVIVDTLPPLDRCSDVAALQADVEPPLPGEAAAVEEVRTEIAASQAARIGGRHDAAEEALRAARTRMQQDAVTYGPVQAQLAVEEANLLEARGKFDDAESVLREATGLAAHWGPREALLEAVTLRLFLVGNRQSRFAEAMQLRELAEGLVEGRPRDEARLLNTLGLLLADQAEYGEAKTAYERALAIYEEARGSNDSGIATVLGNLSNLQKAQGDYDEAVASQQRALAIRERTLGAEHPDVAATLHNLGDIYHQQGKVDQALEMQQRALELFERALGPEHPFVADSCANLAGVRIDQGDYDEAERLLVRALAIQEKALGPEHPTVARNLTNLANVYSAKGDEDKAVELMRRALPIREKALGPEHPDVGETLHNLASAHNVRGEYGLARPLLERALTIWETSLGPEHPRVAQCLDTLALTYKNQGEFDEAARLFERGLAIREKMLGPDHPDVAQTLNNFGNLYILREQYERAAELHERALAIREKAWGPNHPRVGQTLSNLGSIRTAQGQHAEAKRLFERSLAVIEGAVGPDHPAVAYPLDGLTEVALAQGHPKDAVAWAERALKIREATSATPADLAANRFLLAQGLAKSGQDRTRARELARQALDALRELGSPQAEARAEVDVWLRAHGGS